MFQFSHQFRFKTIIMLILLVPLAACGGPSTWHEVSSLEMSSGTLEAGSAVRIEPVAFETVEISGSAFSKTEFVFTGSRSSSGRTALLPAVTVIANDGDFHKMETQFMEAIQWGEDESQKAISFSFVNMPMGSVYSGESHFYFYLTDQDKNCVSNILAWPVAFTE